MKSKLLLSLCLALPSVLSAQGPASAPKPAIAFDSQAVTVQGITPKGRVVWFSMAREVAEDDVATIVRRQEVSTDEDGDGAVSLKLEGEVPLRSIWVAVDLASGEYATASPEGYPLRQVAFRGRGLGRDNARSDRVEDLRGYAEVMVVRPGEGAWGMTVGDGSEADEDGQADGRVAAALDRMRPIAAEGGNPPQRFNPKDVVILIDPNRMELTVVHAGAPQAGTN